jgi:hypothetical protein
MNAFSDQSHRYAPVDKTPSLSVSSTFFESPARQLLYNIKNKAHHNTGPRVSSKRKSVSLYYHRSRIDGDREYMKSLNAHARAT